MQFFIFVLLLCVFLFLFVLFILAKDDVMFLRKNVSVEYLFNISILSLLGGLFFARFIFVIFHFSSDYLNPLVFFIFPYFPGLSLFGGIIGTWMVLTFLLKSKKTFPRGRILDFFSISALSVFPIGYVGYVLLSKRPFLSLDGFFIVIYSFLFLFFIFFFFQKTKKRELAEGSIAYLFLSLVSLFALVTTLSSGFLPLSILYWLQIGLFLFAFALFLFLLNKNEEVITFPQRRVR